MQDHHFTLRHTQGQQLTKDRTQAALYIMDIIQEAHLAMAGTREVLFTDGIQEIHIAMAGTREVHIVTDKTQIQEIHVAVAGRRKY